MTGVSLFDYLPIRQKSLQRKPIRRKMLNFGIYNEIIITNDLTFYAIRY
jgi:hypothetical protein